MQISYINGDEKAVLQHAGKNGPGSLSRFAYIHSAQNSAPNV